MESLETRRVLATFEVTTLSDIVDSGDEVTSLREAISSANALAGNDLITFASDIDGRLIGLSGDLGSLQVSDSVSIIGDRQDRFVVDGQGQGFRVFEVTAGSVVFDGIAIQSGEALGDGEQGGGIRIASAATLTLNQVIMTANSAQNGGAIFVATGGTVTLNESTVSSNIADSGGGLFIETGATLTMNLSRISSNSATFGGGLFSAGNTTINASTISGNDTATESIGAGAGIRNQPGGVLALISSTIDNNFSLGSGGGISNAGVARAINSTISSNYAENGGGGVDNLNTLTLTNSTIVNNGSISSAGGLANQSGGTLTLDNTIVASNFGLGDIDGAAVTGRSNLIGDPNSAGGLTHGNDGNIVGEDDGEGGRTVLNLDLILSNSLSLNGGSTASHALIEDSIAIDAGDNSLAVDATGQTLVNDQRGVPFSRVVDTSVDIGAYEFRRFDSSFFVVNTATDELDFSNSNVSLREAVKIADGNFGPDTITFAASINGSAIELSSSLGQLQVSESVGFIGNGPNNTIIDGNQQGFRVFEISNGDVSIEGLTIRGGEAIGGNGGGILFRSPGELTLKDSVISGNTTQFQGGGIYTSGSTTLDNVTVSDNSSEYEGGGIFNSYANSLDITGSTLQRNVSRFGSGGAIYNSGVLNLSRVTLSDNTATSGGGALLNVIDASATVSRSTIARNSSARGGGLENSGTLTLANSTISGNSADEQGGGLSNVSGSITVVNSTIVGNSATTGGGLANVEVDSIATVHNSIIAGNLTGGDVANSNVLTGNFNLIGNPNSAGGLVHGTDGNILGRSDGTGGRIQIDVNTILRPLALNGGTTETHALVEGSPAIDAADGSLLPAEEIADQRGVARTIDLPGIANAAGGDATDIGAFEAVGVSISDASGTESSGTLRFTVTLSDEIPAGHTVSVLFNTSDLANQATAGSDYTAISNRLVTFNGGESLTQTVTVTLTNDSVQEGDETFAGMISNAVGAFITSGSAIGTITENETQLDFGDAPSIYPVTLASNGARHPLSELFLGTSVDHEADGQASALANADGSDEDGVVQTASQLTSNDAATRSSFNVRASAAGELDAWIDFNQDGDWSDQGEQIFTSVNVVAGDNLLTYTIPIGAQSGETFARFRISTEGALSPNGIANDGEVEDYVQTIVDGDSTAGVTINVVGGSITITLDSTDNVIRSGGTELFRALASLVSSLQINGTASDDTISIDFSSGFVLPASGINIAGALGNNQLVFQGAGDINLTDPDVVVSDVGNIDLASDGANKITLDAASIGRLSPTTKSINVTTGPSDEIEVLNAADWRLISPQIVDGRFVLIAQNQLPGGERIQVAPLLPFKNFLQAGDVNNGGSVSASDALAVIFELNQRRFSDSSGNLVDPLDATSQITDYVDVNGDGKVTAADALNVINILFQQSLSGGSGSGEELSTNRIPSDFAKATRADASQVTSAMTEIAAPVVPRRPSSSMIAVDSVQHSSAKASMLQIRTNSIDEVLLDDDFFDDLRGTLQL